MSIHIIFGLAACIFVFLFFLVKGDKTMKNFLTLVVGCLLIMVIVVNWEPIAHLYTVYSQAQMSKGGH